MTHTGSPDVPSVTLLGTGALGTALGRPLLAAGLPLTVWNRTAARTSTLADLGAETAPDPAAATAHADVVVVVVGDHDQAAEVLTGAGAAGGLQGRVVLTLTSGTPEEAVALDRQVAALGGRPVHGAAMSGTRLVGDPSATFLFSGDRAAYDAAARVVHAWGTPTWVGDDPGHASLHDTALLGLNLGLLGGGYQAMALLGTAGVDPARFAEVARDYLPFAVDLLVDHGRQVAAGTISDDDGTLAVYQAAIGHLVATSERRGLDASVPRGFAALVDRALESGHGDDGLPALVRVIAGSAS